MCVPLEVLPATEFERGETYIFDQSDSSNANYNSQEHPLMFSTGPDGDHNGNGHYMMGVTYKLDGVNKTMGEYVSGFGSATIKTIEWIVPPNAAGTLYYWCHYHTGQGNSLLTTEPYTDISGATSPTYNTGTATYAADNGDRFRCKLSAIGATSDAFTSAALLTVYRTHNIPCHIYSDTIQLINYSHHIMSVTIMISVSTCTEHQWMMN